MHKITEVMPGSIAERCGLMADDTVIRVNDLLVDGMSASDLRCQRNPLPSLSLSLDLYQVSLDSFAAPRYHFGQVLGSRSVAIEALRTLPSDTVRLLQEHKMLASCALERS